MPKVSVIVPVYNVEKYLKKCLDSIINQTLKDIEIICVNDGSTDNSLEILKEYAQKDERIKLINQKNQGIAKVRNLGITIANGEYTGFVDSDDWIDLDFYEKLHNSVVQNNCDIACCNIIRQKKNKKEVLIEYKKVECSEDIKEKFILAGMPKHCYVWNKIYNTKKLQESKIQFPDGMNFEDVIVSPQLIEQLGKLVVVPNTFYNYRKNTKSIVCSNTDKNRADSIEAQEFLHKFCDKYNINYFNTKKYLSKSEYYFLGIKIMKIKQFRATTKYLLFGFIPVWESRKS